ncbi:hypothetical protein IV60_GL001274 [Lancefieldella rimae]|uniref:Uncharacterized protein n=1 Tax=Lancefieldella rimae TaxID=1383 RepID=A0ABR5PZW3_9ACTN|nr:hypothetical protein IV60_GL001274 [Lancefieldella rimae]
MGEQDVADQQGAFAILRPLLLLDVLLLRGVCLCACRRTSLKTTTKRIDFKNSVRYAL